MELHRVHRCATILSVAAEPRSFLSSNITPEAMPLTKFSSQPGHSIAASTAPLRHSQWQGQEHSSINPRWRQRSHGPPPDGCGLCAPPRVPPCPGDVRQHPQHRRHRRLRGPGWDHGRRQQAAARCERAFSRTLTLSFVYEELGLGFFLFPHKATGLRRPSERRNEWQS